MDLALASAGASYDFSFGPDQKRALSGSGGLSSPPISSWRGSGGLLGSDDLVLLGVIVILSIAAALRVGARASGPPYWNSRSVLK